MNTEALSLIISFGAVCLAALSLGWNIYRDVILKPKVKVSFDVAEIHHQDFPEVPKFINISVTNFGPGRIKIMNIVLMDAPLVKRFLQTLRLAIVNPDNKNPLSGKLPSWIEIGDKLDLLLPYNKESFLQRDYTHVGVCDYYGRSHWAPQNDVLAAKKQWKEDFPESKVLRITPPFPTRRYFW